MVAPEGTAETALRIGPWSSGDDAAQALDEARATTRGLVDGRASWETILRSFAAKGLLALPPDVEPETMLH